MNVRQMPLSLLLLGLLISVLSGCGQTDMELFWDGQWSRTITVPKKVQGRCFEERLTILGKQWQLDARVHSTFACDQPFLELTYKGTLDEVVIKRNTDDRDVRFQVKDLHLSAMVDVAGDQRDALSEAAVKKLSEKYVPEAFQTFEQKVWFNKNKTTMRSNIYQPILDLAIPAYPKKNANFVYKRASKDAG